MGYRSDSIVSRDMGPLRQCRSLKFPALLFLACWKFPTFFTSKDFLVFFERFPLFLNDLEGSLEKNSVFFSVAFLALSRRKQGKEDQGNILHHGL